MRLPPQSAPAPLRRAGAVFCARATSAEGQGGGDLLPARGRVAGITRGVRSLPTARCSRRAPAARRPAIRRTGRCGRPRRYPWPASISRRVTACRSPASRRLLPERAKAPSPAKWTGRRPRHHWLSGRIRANRSSGPGLPSVRRPYPGSRACRPTGHGARAGVSRPGQSSRIGSAIVSASRAGPIRPPRFATPASRRRRIVSDRDPRDLWPAPDP